MRIAILKAVIVRVKSDCLNVLFSFSVKGNVLRISTLIAT